MRIKNFTLLVIASALLLAVLVSPGCMLMHFMDDHHSGMMGHGQETVRGRKAVDIIRWQTNRKISLIRGSGRTVKEG
jgi:hypothetical protein